MVVRAYRMDMLVLVAAGMTTKTVSQMVGDGGYRVLHDARTARNRHDSSRLSNLPPSLGLTYVCAAPACARRSRPHRPGSSLR